MSTIRIVLALRRVTLAVIGRWTLAVLALAPLAPHDALATEVPFGSQSLISTSADDAFSVFAADVDGDGDTDILSASFNDDKIAWYENNGANPPVWIARTISTTANGAQSVFAADVDGDGDTDILSASGLDNRIAWYENNGASPPVWTARTISAAANYAFSVFAADVDGDGDTDALSASANDNKIAWYENNGASPPVWTARTISTAPNGPHSVFAMDVDGDRDTDVLSASLFDNKIAWYENNGASPPGWTGRTISTTAGGARSVFAADVDGDGDTDALSASANDDRIAWYENDGGSPPGWIERTISTAAIAAYSVFAADVDGDGDTDALSASTNDNKIAWHENNGASPPGWTERTISTAAIAAYSVFAADVDGDGDTDVLSASQVDNKIAWYENKTIHRTAYFPATHTIIAGANGVGEPIGVDLDRDGDQDILVGEPHADTVAWYESDGGSPPMFIERVIDSGGGVNGAWGAAAGDLDGDGDLDVVSSRQYSGVDWFENTGGTPPGFVARRIDTGDQPARPVALGDMDRDGDLDVVVGTVHIDPSSAVVQWYENDGSPSTGQWKIGAVGPVARTDSIDVIDLDRDGDADVVSASTIESQVVWFDSDGQATPTFTKRTVATGADLPWSNAVVDVNRDGALDVLAAELVPDFRVLWFESDGGAPPAFTQRVVAAMSPRHVGGVVAGDLDADGDVDFVVSAGVCCPLENARFSWYENRDGVGTFTERVIDDDGMPPDPVPLFLVDLDKDGDVDIVTRDSETDTVRWHENRGGQFALATTDTAPGTIPEGATNTVLKIGVSHRGRSGDTHVELSTLELLLEQAPGDPLTSAEANSLIEDLLVYLDNGSGVFEAGSDTLVATLGTLSLLAGRQTVTFADGDANFTVAQGGPRTYFVALHIAAGAPTQATNDFRVTHLTESSSSAEDVSADIPLSLEFAPNVSTGLVRFPPLVISVVPQDNSLDVPVGTNVTVVFSEPVSPATVTASTFRVLDPAGVAVMAGVALAPDGTTATLDPVPPGGALAFDTVYTVEVTGGILDLIGTPVVPFVSRFETAVAPITGTPLPSVSNQSVLPSLPPGPLPGAPSTAEAASGATVGPNLGFSVAAAGDLNDDTLADFVGGAPGYAPGGMTEAGAAALYLGSNAPDPPSGNHPREVADVIFTGQAAHDRAGTSVAAGFDFDGDGIGDILIGAEQVDRTVISPEVIGPGKVYLIYFKPQEYDFNANGIPDYLERPELFVSLGQVGTGISGVVFNGAGIGDQAGFAVAAGGRLESSDARDDIVIGAPGAGNDDGMVYVVFSSSGVSGVKSLGNVGGGIPGVVYEGSAGERLGSSVALPGDVTESAGPDLAMGAPLADTTQIDAGRVYVAAAGGLLAGTVNATAITTQVHGDQACEQLGFAVAGGGDNRAGGTPARAGGDLDLLIGAPYHDAVAAPGNPCLDTTPVPNAGRAIQTTGRLPGSAIGASQVGSTVEGVIWRGVQAGGGLGWSVARLGDLSGNTLDDIGLGAPFVSPGMSGAGAVYVVEGSANAGLLGTIDADQVGQIVSGGIFLGTQFGEEAGLALCATGDLDGDRLSGSATADDFTVGSPGWDAAAGTVHQVLGTLLQQPGECTALGCTVADLETGAVLVVPPNALAQGTKFRFAVKGLASLPASCGSHALLGKSLVGWSDLTRTDCGSPPCQAPGFALDPIIEVPTRQELDYQLTQGEPLALRYCDSTFGWTALPGGPDTGLVQDNAFVADRKAVAATGVDTLRRYGVFFDDQDQDDVRDSCDCSPGDATRWAPPGPAGTLLLASPGASSTTLSWAPPACLGGTPGAILYDTVRSTSPADFVSGAVCVEANGADSTSLDAENPLAGQVFYYIVSPENGCLSSPACLGPACVQRPARDC